MSFGQLGQSECMDVLCYYNLIDNFTKVCATFCELLKLVNNNRAVNSFMKLLIFANKLWDSISEFNRVLPYCTLLLRVSCSNAECRHWKYMAHRQNIKHTPA